MKKITICGHFSDEGGKYNGQTVKTKILTQALSERFPDEEIQCIDTQLVHKNVFLFAMRCFKSLFTSKNIIVLPAQSAVNVLIPFFSVANTVFKRKLHYYVVGGWLKDVIEKNSKLLKRLKKFDGIYVELFSMKADLEALGLKNIIYVSKFRDTVFLKESEIDPDTSEPHRLCFYSRILKQKGIEDAVQAVKTVNQMLNRAAFQLDIYGPVDDNYKGEFEKLQASFGDHISYKGVVDYHEATPVLKHYFAMVFPTYYSGEGYANVVVDAFAAGLPVIATNWKYNAEVIKDGEDGIIYDREKPNALENVLLDICEDPEKIITMKRNSCKRAIEYIPQNAIKPLVSNLR